MANSKAVEQKAQPSTVTVITLRDINVTDEQGAILNKEGYSQCVRTLLQNWRQGTVACQGRSDVSFTNRKPFKQKGTGRARAGSARSPLWKGGGVIFGPQPRTRTMTVNKHMKKQVCSALLHRYVTNNAVIRLDWAPAEGAPKTAHAQRALTQAGLADKNIIFFVKPEDTGTHMSFANIPNVRMLLFDQWNVYDISNGETWLFLEKDMNAFKEMVNSWL